MGKNFRRAKFEWLFAIPSGPPGPGFAKIAAGAVPLPRLALPSKRSRCWIRRRGGCPHPPASLPLPPITVAPPLGGQFPSGAQNLSGFPQFPPGHWALGLQKLPLVRFRFRAWLCRANVPGPGYAVGAGALTRPPVGIWIAVQESTLIRHGFAEPPYPFCPFGTFPPIRGNRPSPLEGEGSGGRLIAAPTVHRKPVGAHSMRPPGFAPGVQATARVAPTADLVTAALFS